MTRTLEKPSDLTGLRVLVVDDEEDIRLGLCKLIGTLGATVAVAADGSEALTKVEREGADLILTDLMMPKMSGSELLQAVKERFPQTVVVVLTGYGTIQSAVTCLQGGAAHFMTKPFVMDDFLKRIETGRGTGPTTPGQPSNLKGRKVPTPTEANRSAAGR